MPGTSSVASLTELSTGISPMMPARTPFESLPDVPNHSISELIHAHVGNFSGMEWPAIQPVPITT